jgi:ubiquitin-conjugating enzyme E2 T
MAQAARLNLRMQKEIKLLLDDPPPGASLNISEDEGALSSLSCIEASMTTTIFYYLLHCLF